MLRKIKTRCLITIPAVLFAANVYANEISYDYIEGSYQSITDSSLGFDVDVDVFNLGGSFSISDNLAVTALYGSGEYDEVAGFDIEATEFDLGITYHQEVSSKTDVFGNFSIVNAEIEISDGVDTVSDDDTGNIITVGLRHMPSDQVEISGGISRIDIFDDTANSFGFGARFFANESISVGAGYNTGDDVDSFTLSIRSNFK